MDYVNLINEVGQIDGLSKIKEIYWTDRKRLKTMKKKILLNKTERGNGETLVYSNPVKWRIPIAKPGFAFKTNKRYKRVKVTLDNWQKI